MDAEGYLKGDRNCQSNDLGCTTGHKRCRTFLPKLDHKHYLASKKAHSWEECGYKCKTTLVNGRLCKAWEFSGNNTAINPDTINECSLWNYCPGRRWVEPRRGWMIGDRNCPRLSKQAILRASHGTGI